MNFGQFLGTAVVLVPAAVIGSIAGGLAAGFTAGAVDTLTDACEVEKETAENMSGCAAGVVGLGAGVWVAGKIIGAVYDSLAD